jgi:hypothetical protein
MVTQCQNQQYLKLARMNQPLPFDKGASMKIPVPAVKSTSIMKVTGATGSPAHPPKNSVTPVAVTPQMIHTAGAIAAEMESRVNNVLLLTILYHSDMVQSVLSPWINAGVVGTTPPDGAIIRTPYPLQIQIPWINGVLFTGGHPPAAG